MIVHGKDIKLLHDLMIDQGNNVKWLHDFMIDHGNDVEWLHNFMIDQGKDVKLLHDFMIDHGNDVKYLYYMILWLRMERMLNEYGSFTYNVNSRGGRMDFKKTMFIIALGKICCWGRIFKSARFRWNIMWAVPWADLLTWKLPQKI